MSDIEELKKDIARGMSLSKIPEEELKRRAEEKKKRLEELKRLQDSIKI